MNIWYPHLLYWFLGDVFFQDQVCYTVLRFEIELYGCLQDFVLLESRFLNLIDLICLLLDMMFRLLHGLMILII